MTYRIETSPKATREWRKLRPSVQDRLSPRILALEEDPRPPDCKKLSPPLSGYRILVGDYRVIYNVDDDEGVVTITKVAKRESAYS